MLEAVASDQFAVQPALPARHAGPWHRPSMRLTASFITLTCLGLVMAVSAVGSGSLAPALVKRLALTTLGVCAFVLGAQVRYQWWRRHHLAALGVALAALTATLIPGIGMQINGARRWVNVGLPIGFQPSEFAKIALCMWVAAYCARNSTRMRDPLHGFLVPCGVIAFTSLLILCEPDFGTAVLTGALCMTILVASGTRLIYVLLAGAAAMPLLQRLVLGVPYRLQRVLTFLDPWSDPRGSGYQLIQSKIAIGSGGLFGLGLGAGHQKVGFLPGAGNDFIFSILAEELGLMGSLLVIALFLFILWEGLKVVTRARDPFGFGLALGLTVLLTAQAAAHIAVVTGSVPTKGLSLPFISAGGSSLIATMLAAGILVSIARSEERPERYGLRPWQDDRPGYERLACRLLRPIGAAWGHTARRLLSTRKAEGGD